MNDITITIPLHLLGTPIVAWTVAPTLTLALSHPKVAGKTLIAWVRKVPGAAKVMDKYRGQFNEFMDAIQEANDAAAKADADTAGKEAPKADQAPVATQP